MRTNTATLPAPVLGWNTRDPIDQMKEGYANKLINIYPDQGFVRSRKGYRLHCNTGQSGNVESLIELPLQSGSTSLLAAVSGRLINVTTATPATLATGLTDNKWQYTIFGNTAVLVNGSDDPRHFDGATVTIPTYQSHPGFPGLSPANLIQVTVYRNRLFFVEKGTCSIWYGDTQAKSGDLKKFDIQYVLHNGGSIAFIAPWSRDTGVGLQDFLVIMTSEGEVLVYEGSNPDDAANWKLSARFFLPEPVAGRRNYINLGSDLLIVHKGGVTPLGQLLTSGNTAKYATVSDIINKAFLDATSAWGNEPYWSLAYHPLTQALYINVPIAGDHDQFILNVTTGAWALFHGMYAFSWANMNDDIFFGGQAGKVYQANWEHQDNGQVIPCELKTAYSFFGDRAYLKRFTLVRPQVKATPNFRFSLAVDCDFDDGTFQSIVTSGVTGSLWDTSLWNVALWSAPDISVNDVYSLTNLGRAASLSLAVQCNGTPFEMYAAAITYERGGLL